MTFVCTVDGRTFSSSESYRKHLLLTAHKPTMFRFDAKYGVTYGERKV